MKYLRIFLIMLMAVGIAFVVSCGDDGGTTTYTVNVDVTGASICDGNKTYGGVWPPGKNPAVDKFDASFSIIGTPVTGGSIHLSGITVAGNNSISLFIDADDVPFNMLDLNDGPSCDDYVYNGNETIDGDKNITINFSEFDLFSSTPDSDCK